MVCFGSWLVFLVVIFVGLVVSYSGRSCSGLGWSCEVVFV